MSWLTRIFVVLVMVFSVVLVALTVPYVINTNTYKQKYQATLSRLRAAEAAAEQAQAALTQKFSRKNATIDRLTRQVTDLQKKIDSLTTRLAQTQGALVSVRSNYSALQTQVKELSTALATATQLNDVLTAEVQTRRKKMLAIRKKLIDLNQKLREKIALNQQLVQRVRLFQEKIHQLQRRIRQVSTQGGATVQIPSSAGGAGIASSGSAVLATPTIEGSIQDVQRIKGKTYIAINLGQSDNIRKGMQLTIIQGSDFVGEAVVTQVRENAAVAEVTLQVTENIPATAQVRFGEM